MTSRPRPSFRVRNLGPIAEGTVQLHPLTILIGKNNTGKNLHGAGHLRCLQGAGAGQRPC